MISPESVMMATRQMRSDDDSASFGLFEVPDVTTPPLSPIPMLSSEQPLALTSTSVIPSAPAAYDADLFYNPEVPVSIDYGQSEKAACTITEADESVDYVTEADASLGYTAVTDEGCSSSSSSSSSSSKIVVNNNNNNNNTTLTTAKEDEKQSAVQKNALQTILRLTVGKKIVEKNLHWELFRQHQQITDEELARHLQEQWQAEDRFINRSKDSANPYSLRVGTRKKTEQSYAPKPTPARKKTSSGKVGKTRLMQNQKTIKEAFARTRAMNK